PGDRKNLFFFRPRQSSTLDESLGREVSEVLRGLIRVALVLNLYKVVSLQAAELGNFNKGSDLRVTQVVFPVSILMWATIPALDVSRAFLSVSRFRLFAATSTASAGFRPGILSLAFRLLFRGWIGSAVVFWIEVVAGHCSGSLVVI